MYRWLDGWLYDERVDRGMIGRQTDGQRNDLVHGYLDDCMMSGWMEELLDGWIDGCFYDGQLDRKVVGSVYGWLDDRLMDKGMVGINECCTTDGWTVEWLGD
jgi:hypothetical protein